MNLVAVAAAVITLAAIVVNVMAIVMGFKDSLKKGIIAILAPLLLSIGLTLGYTVAHQAAMAEVGAAEVRQQGEDEARQQIEDLQKADNIDLGL
ncbi:MAG: hypothetical protein JXX14_09055 [Deltaproteobacteria bacterium]|nr:hypothetical protein [Deltaproteobacteria bacterium]